MDNLTCRYPLPAVAVMTERLTHDEAIAFLMALVEKVDDVLDDWDCNDLESEDFGSALIETVVLADLYTVRARLDTALHPGELLP